jgi:hypothetical protein
MQALLLFAVVGLVGLPIFVLILEGAADALIEDLPPYEEDEIEEYDPRKWGRYTGKDVLDW